MKTYLLAALAAAAWALAFLTTTSSASIETPAPLSPHPVVSYEGELADAKPRDLAFVVPDYPGEGEPEAWAAVFTVELEREIIVGGQNRSSETHAGIPLDRFNGVLVHLYWLEAGLQSEEPWMDSVLPSSWYSERIQAWGPTEPAPNWEDWVMAPNWERAFLAGDPSIYWGVGLPPTPQGPPEPTRTRERHLLTGTAVEPGETISGLFRWEWDVPDWPPGHHWPRRFTTRVDLEVYFEWVPADEL